MPKGIPGSGHTTKRRRRQKNIGGANLTRTSIAGSTNNLAMMQALNLVNAGIAQLNAICVGVPFGTAGTTQAYGRKGRQAANVSSVF